MIEFRKAKSDRRKSKDCLLTILVGVGFALVGLTLPAYGRLEVGSFDTCDKSREEGGLPLNDSRPSSYSGMCAASAAVPLGPDHFMVGNDEDNVLRVYSICRPDIVQGFKLSEYFASIVDGGRSSNTDIEGGAKLGTTIFWIGSHSRNNEGLERRARYRLFAHEVEVSGQKLLLKPIGKPYAGLLDDLKRDSRLSKYKLSEAEQRPAKAEGALNIEGICSAPDGKALLIGFRNPVTNNMALVVPLLNPMNVVEKNDPAILGDPIDLDLGGFGIRDLAWWDDGKTCFIIAGPYHDNKKEIRESFRLYRWTGRREDKPDEIKTDEIAEKFARLNPEALIIYPSQQPGRCRLQILSDDEDDHKCPTNSFGSVRIDFPK